MGDTVIGPVTHRIKGLGNALIKMIQGKVKMSPLSQIMSAIKVARLMM
ncbi:MAG: hypothetical protein ACTSVE_14430 [Candidatus Helarchaeota archaeon]